MPLRGFAAIHPQGETLEVACYSGYRENERPSVVRLGASRWNVSELLARWREPEAELFLVRLDDGSRLRLRRDTRSGCWSAAGVDRP